MSALLPGPGLWAQEAQAQSPAPSVQSGSQTTPGWARGLNLSGPDTQGVGGPLPQGPQTDLVQATSPAAAPARNRPGSR